MRCARCWRMAMTSSEMCCWAKLRGMVFLPHRCLNPLRSSRSPWLISAWPWLPRSGGGLPDTLAAATIHANVANPIWRHASELAQAFLARVAATKEFSPRFAPCFVALTKHIDAASAKIGRLG